VGEEAVDPLEEAIEVEKDEGLVDGVVEHEVDPLLDVVLERGDRAAFKRWRHGSNAIEVGIRVAMEE
jgi:hypothetical protein